MAAMFEGLLGGGGPQGGKEQSVFDKHWERLVTLRTQKVNGKVDGWKPKTDDDILTCLHTSRRRKRERVELALCKMYIEVMLGEKDICIYL